jgi:hypothetical protein
MNQELTIRLTAIEKLIDKSTYFWTEHIQQIKKRHYIEADMWSKKFASTNRLLNKIIEKTLGKEELWK